MYASGEEPEAGDVVQRTSGKRVRATVVAYNQATNTVSVQVLENTASGLTEVSRRVDATLLRLVSRAEEGLSEGELRAKIRTQLEVLPLGKLRLLSRAVRELLAREDAEHTAKDLTLESIETLEVKG